jgi:hypothetical protein
VGIGNVFGAVIIFGVKGKVMEECIVITDKTRGDPVKRFAYPIGDWLCAVKFARDQFKIYKLKQCKPFIGTIFPTLEDALGAIKVFNEVYGEYFPIWENREWTDANIPELCQWSIRNGVNIAAFIRKAEEDGVSVRCSSLYEVA